MFSFVCPCLKFLATQIINTQQRYISYRFEVLTAVSAFTRILMMEAAGYMEMSLHFYCHTI
jgi:hypothetical protein